MRASRACSQTLADVCRQRSQRAARTRAGQHRTLRAAANNAQAAHAARTGSSRRGDAGCEGQARERRGALQCAKLARARALSCVPSTTPALPRASAAATGRRAARAGRLAYRRIWRAAPAPLRAMHFATRSTARCAGRSTRRRHAHVAITRAAAPPLPRLQSVSLKAPSLNVLCPSPVSLCQCPGEHLPRRLSIRS
jgi:hypothetical protein